MTNTNPSGQQSDFFGTKVSIPGINVSSAGDNQLILKDDYSSRIYYDANGNPSVLLGLRRKNANNGLSANQQGLYVSQTAIDVTQATDSQLVFNSSQDIFKIIKKIPFTIPSFSIDGGAGHNFSLVTQAHGQLFIPLTNVYVVGNMINGLTSSLITSSYIPLPFTASTSINNYVFPAANSNSYILDILFGVDATNIYIQASCSTVVATTINAIPGTCFVLQETTGL
jgi:hypothetical protein